jgi:putative transposase
MLYATNISEVAWDFISPIFEKAGHRLQNRKHSLREILNACLYVVDNGTKWRNLPNDFTTWKTVYHYFRLWSKSGIWQSVNDAVIEAVRFSSGRELSPSLASVDSQSQTAELGVEERGLDGNKCINGRKKHIAVDCLGLLLCCNVTAANVHDSGPGEWIVDHLNDDEEFPRMEKILGDNAYKKVGATQRVRVTVENKEREPGSKGFVPEAFRWAVERTFAWLNRQRRLVRNYEKKTVHQESMNYIGNIRICLKRLEKWWA